MSFIYIPNWRGPAGVNTVVGVNAMSLLTTGLQNSAFGYESLNDLTSGSGNTAVGFQALDGLTTGSDNTAVGRNAGAGATGSYNTIIGVSTGRSFFGFSNTIIGTQSVGANGSSNIFIGFNAGSLQNSGSGNVIIGGFTGNLFGVDTRNASGNVVISTGQTGAPIYSFLFTSAFGGNPALFEHGWKSSEVTAPDMMRLRRIIHGATTNAILDIAGEWSTTGAANGIRLNVTDTASAAGALLMDLRVGGVSSFNVDKSGNAKVLAGLLGGEGPSYAFKNAFNGEALFHASYSISWASGGASLSGAASLTITRDASDALAQRRGPNPQAFRIYNTFTDASNYERGYVRWSGGVFQIGTEFLGTGSSRSLQILSAGGAVATFDTLSNVVIGTGAIATNAANGFFYVAGCAGAPTGTPTAFTGRVPIVVDTTNHKLYFYSGGSWRDAGP